MSANMMCCTLHLTPNEKLENRPTDALAYLHNCITVISVLLFAVVFALLYYWYIFLADVIPYYISLI